MADDAPLLMLKPKISVALIPTMIYWLILGAWLALYVRPAFFFLGNFWIGYLLAFVVVWGVAIFVRYMNLKHRNYNFFKDRAEFQEGFLNIDQKTVPYDKVTDITLRKTVWDRLFGTGTITVATAGTFGGRGFLNYGAGGIAIQYVETPDDEYKFIQQLVRKK